MITPIIKSHEDYLFPNYCFAKKFGGYFFLRPDILHSGESNFDLFFKLLKYFQDSICQVYGIENIWQLYVPGPVILNFSNDKEAKKIEFVEQNHRMLLAEIKLYIANKLPSYLGMPFIGVFNKFWLALEEKIQVYIDDDFEVIVIGVDNFRNCEMLEHIINEFGYKDGFAEYVDIYKNIFLGFTEERINILNSIFLT